MEKNTSQDVVAKPSKSQLKAEAKLKLQQEQRQSKRADSVKFILAAILVAVGVWAFYALAAQLPVYIRSLFPLVGVVVAIAIVFFWTATGRELTSYVRESVVEAKKVVWPERNETLRMTLFVIVFVAILALFIWGVDSLISWLFFDIFMKRS
ncbi:preprotein translocase subunit SecE [Snodgrassella sp. CFCC 13594]|uniref:preprotein translocase subunit SecE n=1 Tax=Snodgrassella sp. CFCC 13594 TaxID=1775559 RepID=UPI00083388F9|nr:preprotein translocase subunit SecE [Snodgrassella sp. CFCC 13594]